MNILAGHSWGSTNFHWHIIEHCIIHKLVHTWPVSDWMSIMCWLSVGQAVEGVSILCMPSDVDTAYKLSTNRLVTVPPHRSLSLVSELEQISPITESRSSPEIPNIWWDIEQNTHQVWHYSNLKSKRNIGMSLTIKPAADIVLSEIHSSQFIWKTIISTLFNKDWLL